jgi:hypothetical protein
MAAGHEADQYPILCLLAGIVNRLGGKDATPIRISPPTGMRTAPEKKLSKAQQREEWAEARKMWERGCSQRGQGGNGG